MKFLNWLFRRGRLDAKAEHALAIEAMDDAAKSIGVSFHYVLRCRRAGLKRYEARGLTLGSYPTYPIARDALAAATAEPLYDGIYAIHLEATLFALAVARPASEEQSGLREVVAGAEGNEPALQGAGDGAEDDAGAALDSGADPARADGMAEDRQAARLDSPTL